MRLPCSTVGAVKTKIMRAVLMGVVGLVGGLLGKERVKGRTWGR
jgi:hypothetical protein